MQMTFTAYLNAIGEGIAVADPGFSPGTGAVCQVR